MVWPTDVDRQLPPPNRRNLPDERAIAQHSTGNRAAKGVNPSQRLGDISLSSPSSPHIPSFFPSLPSFPSSPFRPLNLPSLKSPIPPSLISRLPLPLIQLSGGACKFPSGSGQSQAAKRHLVHFGLKMLHVRAVLSAYSAKKYRQN